MNSFALGSLLLPEAIFSFFGLPKGTRGSLPSTTTEIKLPKSQKQFYLFPNKSELGKTPHWGLWMCCSHGFQFLVVEVAMAVPIAPYRAHGLDAWKIHEFLSWWVGCAMEVCGVMPHSFIARCSRKHHIVAVMVRHPLSRLMCKGQVRSQTKN